MTEQFLIIDRGQSPIPTDNDMRQGHFKLKFDM